MRVGRIANWGLSLGLAAALVGMVGLPKLIGPDPNPIFALIAGRSGIALFEPYLRYATGVAEISAALLLVWPRSRQIGALLASAITLSKRNCAPSACGRVRLISRSALGQMSAPRKWESACNSKSTEAFRAWRRFGRPSGALSHLSDCARTPSSSIGRLNCGRARSDAVWAFF